MTLMLTDFHLFLGHPYPKYILVPPHPGVYTHFSYKKLLIRNCLDLFQFHKKVSVTEFAHKTCIPPSCCLLEDCCLVLSPLERR